MSDRHLERYLGDGAYAYVRNDRALVFYASDGIRETNQVVIDVADLDRLMLWLEGAVKLAKRKQ